MFFSLARGPLLVPSTHTHPCITNAPSSSLQADALYLVHPSLFTRARERRDSPKPSPLARALPSQKRPRPGAKTTPDGARRSAARPCGAQRGRPSLHDRGRGSFRGAAATTTAQRRACRCLAGAATPPPPPPRAAQPHAPPGPPPRLCDPVARPRIGRSSRRRIGRSNRRLNRLHVPGHLLLVLYIVSVTR